MHNQQLQTDRSSGRYRPSFAEVMKRPELSNMPYWVYVVAWALWTVFPIDDMIGAALGLFTGPAAVVVSPLLAWGDEFAIFLWLVYAAVRMFSNWRNASEPVYDEHIIDYDEQRRW